MYVVVTGLKYWLLIYILRYNILADISSFFSFFLNWLIFWCFSFSVVRVKSTFFRKTEHTDCHRIGTKSECW